MKRLFSGDLSGGYACALANNAICLIKKLPAAGVPIYAVGLQDHNTDGFGL
jgi:GH35 family endo-1,4-beta-xylanase